MGYPPQMEWVEVTLVGNSRCSSPIIASPHSVWVIRVRRRSGMAISCIILNFPNMSCFDSKQGWWRTQLAIVSNPRQQLLMTKWEKWLTWLAPIVKGRPCSQSLVQKAPGGYQSFWRGFHTDRPPREHNEHPSFRVLCRHDAQMSFSTVVVRRLYPKISAA